MSPLHIPTDLGHTPQAITRGREVVRVLLIANSSRNDLEGPPVPDVRSRLRHRQHATLCYYCWLLLAVSRVASQLATGPTGFHSSKLQCPSDLCPLLSPLFVSRPVVAGCGFVLRPTELPPSNYGGFEGGSPPKSSWTPPWPTSYDSLVWGVMLTRQLESFLSKRFRVRWARCGGSGESIVTREKGWGGQTTWAPMSRLYLGRIIHFLPVPS